MPNSAIRLSGGWKKCASVKVMRISSQPGLVSLSAAMYAVRGRSDASASAISFSASTTAEMIPPAVVTSGRFTRIASANMSRAY